jgi:hypothetical protein
MSAISAMDTVTSTSVDWSCCATSITWCDSDGWEIKPDSLSLAIKNFWQFVGLLLCVKNLDIPAFFLSSDVFLTYCAK